ncbi:hypothetical protein Dip510_001501 [Elusimicrobium posterum]|uniref:hypothetical protein n=1 Tax=Elusimicrobium posterum TaxID=3116653 RepID=UPI003C7767FE
MKRLTAVCTLTAILFSALGAHAQEWGNTHDFQKELYEKTVYLQKDNLTVDNTLLKIKEAELKEKFMTPEEKARNFRQGLTDQGKQVFDILMKEYRVIEDWEKYALINYLRNKGIPEQEKVALAPAMVEVLALTDGGKELLEGVINSLTSDTYSDYYVRSEGTHVLSGLFELIELVPELLQHGEDRRPKITKKQMDYNKIAADGYMNNTFFKNGKTLIAATLVEAYADNFFPDYSTPDFLLEISRKNTHRLVKAQALLGLSKANYAAWRGKEKEEIMAKLMALYFCTDDLAEEIPAGSVAYQEFDNEFARAFTRMTDFKKDMTAEQLSDSKFVELQVERVAGGGHWLADGSVIKTFEVAIPIERSFGEAVFRSIVDDENPYRTYMNIFFIAQGAQGASNIAKYFKNMKNMPAMPKPDLGKNVASKSMNPANPSSGGYRTAETFNYNSTVKTNVEAFARQPVAQTNGNMPVWNAHTNKFVSVGGNTPKTVKLNPYNTSAYEGGAALKLSEGSAGQMRVIVSSSSTTSQTAAGTGALISEGISLSGRPVIAAAGVLANQKNNWQEEAKETHVGDPVKKITKEERDAQRAREIERELDSDYMIDGGVTLTEIHNLNISENLKLSLMGKYNRRKNNKKNIQVEPMREWWNQPSASYPPFMHQKKEDIAFTGETYVLDNLDEYKTTSLNNLVTVYMAKYLYFNTAMQNQEYPLDAVAGELYRGMALNQKSIENIKENGVRRRDLGRYTGAHVIPGNIYSMGGGGIWTSEDPTIAAQTYASGRLTLKKGIPTVVHIDRSMTQGFYNIDGLDGIYSMQDVPANAIKRISVMLKIDGKLRWGQLDLNAAGQSVFKPYKGQ